MSKAMNRLSYDPVNNYEELKSYLNIAFDDPSEKNIQAVVNLLENPEYTFLLNEAQNEKHKKNKSNMIFAIVSDSALIGGSDNKKWIKFTDVLDRVLTVAKEQMPASTFDATVNYIGANLKSFQKDKDGKKIDLLDTMRGIISQSECYEDSIACRTRFNDLFRKFGLKTKEQYLQDENRLPKTRDKEIFTMR